ncbi:MAG: 3,4-dehydroadipyl-CoA semialdehyde dehydrogenase [Neomegalonema sp.]|nr:3,4-dehydroadipyl-CoA semialdehyde dehydrogenase [Neomegalonema sp.]
MKLESYVNGQWRAGAGEGRPLINASTGEEIARADATGLDLGAATQFARERGTRALSALSFAERGALLKAIADTLQEHRAEFEDIARRNSGNTSADAAIDIDGGVFTLKTYARLGKSLGDAKMLIEADQEQLARDPVFFARHLWTTRPGAAVQINAFNFPSWGMWEKVAQALLAGVASVAKPATSTALLSERMARRVVEANILPEGALSLICGGADGLIDGLGPMDSVAFTGSADTANFLRRQIATMDPPPRLTVEADSVNATIIGPDVRPDDAVFDLAVREIVKATSVKAGQLCTNIRRIFAPADLSGALIEAAAARISKLKVGDPQDDAVRVGPLINAAQRDDALGKIERLLSECREVAAAPPPDAPAGSGFVAPRLLVCDAPEAASAAHEIEVFGPCATIMPYESLHQAAALATKAAGALALSLFSNNPETQMSVAAALGPWHGRLLMVDEEVGKNHTGHSIVMPQCVHGGPGRAGDGEELGGLRGLRLHLQRSAIQGGPAALTALSAAAAEASL